MYRTSDVVNVLPAGGYGGYGNGFGGDGGWAAILALAALGGGGLWGRGGYGNECCGGSGTLANELATDTAAIQSQITASDIDAKVCNVEMAVAESKYATALGQKDLTYAIQENKYDLGSKIDACCCNTQRSIDQVRFDATLSNCQQNNYLAQEFCKVNRNIDDLRRDTEVAALKERIRVQDALLDEASQRAQDQRILAGVQALLAANSAPAA